MLKPVRLTAYALAGLGSVACAANDDERVDLLDPQAAHFGKTYAEWAGAWVQYINDVAPPECVNPIADDTGAHCTLYQDPSSPVFFLAGTHGGPALRTECRAPASKALFFPLVNIWGDNAGVPESELLSDAELKNYVESNIDLIDPESLYLIVDEQPIEHLERTGFSSAPYTVQLVPGASIYACQGVELMGETFPGYVGGYWALLPPLTPGKHVIEFGGKTSGPLEDLTIDVRYELTLE